MFQRRENNVLTGVTLKEKNMFPIGSKLFPLIVATMRIEKSALNYKKKTAKINLRLNVNLFKSQLSGLQQTRSFSLVLVVSIFLSLFKL